jgi:hypothetical protein
MRFPPSMNVGRGGFSVNTTQFRGPTGGVQTRSQYQNVVYSNQERGARNYEESSYNQYEEDS